MHHTLQRATLGLLLIAVLVSLTGCSVTRKQEIKRLSNRVESDLKSEQRAVLKRPTTDPERSQRLDHLTTLKTTHSVANVGLATAPRLLAGDDLLLAYDVLEEVFGVIDWNIPLMPGEGTKPLPTMFGPGGLNFSALQADSVRSPSTPSGYSR